MTTTFDHERVILVNGERSGVPLIVAVHSTALGQAVGGCRLWRYDDWSDGLIDALRLSKAMTLKCALSGLALGGGKSVVALAHDDVLTPESRRDIFLDLGDVIESLDGMYGVGEDVGTTAEDMLVASERTRFAYGLPIANGGMGETSDPTASAIYDCIRVTARKVFGTDDLSGRRMTIVGLGQVGSRLARRLGQDGVKLTVTDVDAGKREIAAEVGAEWVAPELVLSADADLLVPCALGGFLTRDAVSSLRCAAIVGPANNQLATDDVADALAAAGILWAPDFLVSAGGVVYGAEVEVAGKTSEQAMQSVAGIAATLTSIFERADVDGITPLAAASAVANDRIARATVQRG
ncbi:MAG: amino acid dehydrogenase [Frankiaceae bacterium]|nr:amino acid dehydrogenase [Frankiaceae bacterium]